MLVRADPGTEKFVAWARHKAAQLAELARDLKLESMRKAFLVDGAMIFIRTRSSGDHFIRITGQARAKGRMWLDVIPKSGGELAVPRRFYLMDGTKLKEYEEADLSASPPGLHDLALSGRTLYYTGNDAPARVRLTRRGRPPQDTGLFSAESYLTLTNWSHPYADIQTNPINLGTENKIRRLTMHPSLSEDGRRAVVTGNYASPTIYRLSAAQLAEEAALPRAQWTAPTQFDIASSGLPPQIDAFYASRAISQRIVTTDSGSYINDGAQCRVQMQRVYLDLTAGSAWATPSWRVIAGQYTGGNANVAVLPRARYSRFEDRLYMLFTLPWVSRIVTAVNAAGSPPGQSRTVEPHLDVRWWLLRYDYTTESWVSVWTRDVSEVAADSFLEFMSSPGVPGTPTGSQIGFIGGVPIYGNTNPPAYVLPNLSKVESPTGYALGFQLPLVASTPAGTAVLYTQPNVVIGPPSISTNPSDFGTIFLSGTLSYAGTNQLWLGDTMLTDQLPLTADTVSLTVAITRVWAYADNGFLVHYESADGAAVPSGDPLGVYWFHRPDASSPFARTYLGSFLTAFVELRDQLYMSPDGRKLWTKPISAPQVYKYYEDGVLLATIPGAATGLPARSSSDQLQYVTELLGWSYDNPTQMRLKYGQVLPPVSNTRQLQGGLMHIEGFGDLALPSNPLAPADGFTLDGIYFVQADGLGGWQDLTAAQVSVLFGGPAVTYFPNGITYTATSSVANPPPETGEAIAEYNATLAVPKILRKLSKVGVAVASRGFLTENVPLATGSVSLSDELLVEDEFLQRT